jgi:hypothetical protein
MKNKKQRKLINFEKNQEENFIKYASEDILRKEWDNNADERWNNL